MKNDLLDDLSELDEKEANLLLPTSVGGILRSVAFLFDCILIIVFSVVLGTVVSVFTLIVSESVLTLIYQVLFISLFLLYYPLLESSRLQASVGKFVVSIKVVNRKGERLTFIMALARLMANVVACMPLFLGIIMIAFTDKRGMHDMMTDTYVVKNKQE
jgi:uncharacterized RDD family membrane protein YckC